MVGFSGYFDGSKDHQKNQWLTLAGMASTDALWAKFDSEWNAILGNRSPKAEYLHMREATKLEGAFSRHKGWNDIWVQQLVTDLILYLNGLDKNRFMQVACSVDLIAYRKLADEGLVLDSPEYLCVSHCPGFALAWFVADYPKDELIHSINYFFDRGEPFEEVCKQMWNDETKKPISVNAGVEIWSLLQSITSIKSAKKCPPMQAADLVAWAANRERTSESDRPWRHLSEILRAGVPSALKIWDEKKLREKYAKK